MENMWSFHSIYELQFFNCPSCNYKNKSKQEFVDHACNVHPESINNLMNIKDIGDVVCPWNEIVIKDEIIELVDGNDESENISDTTTEYHENQGLVTLDDETHPKSFLCPGDQKKHENSQVANTYYKEMSNSQVANAYYL